MIIRVQNGRLLFNIMKAAILVQQGRQQEAFDHLRNWAERIERRCNRERGAKK